MDFPYKKKFIKNINEKIKDIKNNIPNYSDKPYKPIAIINSNKLIDGTLDNKYIRIITPDSAYDNVNILTDYFTEESRMHCKFKQNKSPYEYFTENKKYIIRKLQQQGKTICEYNIREFIYNNCKECNSFKVTTAIFIYDFFKAKTVLDFSAGWGDRLLAACGLGIKYTGIDPNLSNVTGYNEIIKLTNANATVFTSGAEYMPLKWLPFTSYDLIFTSPPFFDYEIYSSKLQSVSSYTTYENWLVYFLFIIFIKYRPFVKKNICIYIQDVNNMNFCEPIILFLCVFIGCRFMGIISEKFPMLCFEINNDFSMNKKYKNIFKYNFTYLYKLSKQLIKNNIQNIYKILVKTQQKPNGIFIRHLYTIYRRVFFKYLIYKKYKEIVYTGDTRMAYELSIACKYLNIKCNYYGKIDKYIKNAVEKYSLNIINEKKPTDLYIDDFLEETIRETFLVLNIQNDITYFVTKANNNLLHIMKKICPNSIFLISV